MSGILAALAGIKTAIATAVDEYFNRTTLLLNTSSTNGAQNNTFLDSSTNNFTITRNGNTTQGTFTPFSQTGWSNFFDGSTAYLTTPSNAALAYGSGDFTFEAFSYITSNASANSRLLGNWAGSWSANFWSLHSNHSSYVGKYSFFVYNYNSGSAMLVSTSDVPLNQWVHIAITRSSNTWRLFINGVLEASQTSSASIDGGSSDDMFIGGTGQAGEYSNGYMSNVRLVKGTAVYTSAFTPSTTPLTAISGTSLLTCQSNRFADSSTNAFAITLNGSPSVQAFSPFAPTAAYDTAVVGGSGYFDGSGDSLTTSSNANLAIGTSDFCIEWFYYQTSTQTSATPFCQWGGGVTDWILQYNSSNFIFYYASGSTSISYSYTPVPNQWTHGCVCRSGSTMSLYLNGVRVNTKTDSTSIPNTTGITVGRNPDGGQDATGYISNVRLVVGSSVYNPSSTTLTVPTAPLTAVTGTKFLLSATNTGIFDSTAKNVLETVGNAQVSTTQAKWGSTSIYLDGSGDYLLRPNSNLYDFGTGEFTIEMWIYPTSVTGSDKVIMDTRASGSDTGYTPYITSSSKLAIYSGGADRITSSTSISANTWTHIAFVRYGTTLAIYLNGTRDVTATYSSAINCLGRVSIGCGFDNAANLPAYIDDLRITKGYARYSSASFTLPTAAFPLQ